MTLEREPVTPERESATETYRPQDAPEGAPSGDDQQPFYETGGLRLGLLIGAIAVLGLLAGWAYPLIIGGVVVMIFLHELGHYVTARLTGMKATEFFIGFGPRLWSFRKGETEYGIKAIPAGAYVRIIGMNNLDEVDPADEPRTYRQQSFPKRLLVVSAGSIMHMVQAFILLVLLLGVVGVPGGSLSGPPDDENAPAWSVGEVIGGSAAADAGIEDGDRIVAVDGTPAVEFDDGLTSALARFDVGDEVDLTVVRDGERLTLPATMQGRPDEYATSANEAGTPFLGVTSGDWFPDETIGLGRAVVEAPGQMVGFIGDAVGAMFGFFSPDGLSDFADNVRQADEPSATTSGSGDAQASDDGDENRVISIVGFVNIAAQLTEEGWGPVLSLFFMINVFIGILNMAPLPPLDGGHAAVAIYERIRSKPGRRYHVDMAKLLPLTYAVVMGLVVIGFAAIYLDIVDPLSAGG
jgi:membrane-associated protease RseP (regulator of RpoE activity)